MYPVKTATAVTSRPPYNAEGAPGFFTAGNAVAGIPATVPGEHWFNMTQEELLNVIRAAGLAPSATDDTQLRQAVAGLILDAVAGHNESAAAHADIRQLIAGINIPAASETVAGIVRLSTADEAHAGTDNTTAMSPTDVATAIAAARWSDALARDNAAMSTFVAHLTAGRASGPVPRGGIWTLATNELSGSGAYYDASGHAYHNQVPSSVDHSGTISAGTPNVSGYTVVDTSVVIANGRVVTHVRIYATASSTGVIYVFQRTAAGAYTVVASGGFSHTGSGWEQFALSAAYTVPATGTYMVGAYSANFGACSYHTAGRAYKTGSSSGSVTMSEDMISGVAMGYAYLATATNMTLTSPGLALGYTPAQAELFLLHQSIDAVTLGADIVVSASRGSGWAVASELTALCAYDATYRLLRARFDLSGLAAGTSGLFKIETFNTKAQGVRAALLWAEAA